MKSWMSLLLMLGLSACATNAVSGRKQLMLVSEEQAIVASKQAYVAEVQKLKTEGKLSTDVALNNRVYTITKRLIAQAIAYRPETRNWEWSVQVINEPKVANAYCMAGGRMAIYTGIINQLDASDDEIAQVMGHEIAHALSAHTAEKMSEMMLLSGVVAGLGVAKGDRAAMLAGLAGGALSMKYSRDKETESDEIGILLAAKAGYNPNAAVTLWQKMAQLGGGETSGTVAKVQSFFSTHPSSSDRIANMKKMAPKMMPFFLQGGEREEFPLQL
jgi:predicted Zn-dependent protease